MLSNEKYQLVPVEIKPYLLPFIALEFEVKEQAIYGNLMAKIIDISTKTTLGKMIRLMCVKSGVPFKKTDKYTIFLRIENKPNLKKWEGKLYKMESGKYSFLKLSEEGMLLLNSHMENIFSMSLLYFLEGYLSRNPDQGLRKGIDLFMIKYDLYKYEIDPETIRRKFYRYRQENKRINFFQQTPKKPKAHVTT